MSVFEYIVILLIMCGVSYGFGFTVGYTRKTDKYVKMKIEEMVKTFAEKQFKKMWSKDD